MVSDLLITAKKHEKEKKYEKAIDNLEQILKRTKGNSDTEVYISYAKCLRKISNTDQAKDILTKGLEQHPNNEGILFEFLNLYDSLYDWESAKQIALSLININSEKADYHFRLGRVYAFLHKSKEAEQAYKTGLKHKHQISFEKLTKKVQSGFTDDPSKAISKYSFIYGKNNLGTFTHQYDDQKFFTKISQLTGIAKREETFYKSICSDFPNLKNITPSYIDSQIIDNIMYLTIEMIDDIPIKIKHTDKIITAVSQISKIKYQDIIKKYPNPRYSFQFNDRPISIFRFFTQIHKEYYNKKLFSSFNKLLKQNKYPKLASKTIQRLESLIMDNKLYFFIKPEEHYSLLHGDLISSNLKINKENETPIIFDWATYNVGLHFMDITNYLSSKFIPYSEVKRIYLLNYERGQNLSLIEKIFFLYALVLLYIVSPSKRTTIDERLSDFIIPAINDIEILVSQFKVKEFGQVVESLSIERKAAEVKIRDLNKKIQTLKKEKQIENNKSKKENKNLQTQFNNLLDSKSWKLTAPLRKIVQWTKKNKNNN